jgi:hypothetical protein
MQQPSHLSAVFIHLIASLSSNPHHSPLSCVPHHRLFLKAIYPFPHTLALKKPTRSILEQCPSFLSYRPPFWALGPFVQTMAAAILPEPNYAPYQRELVTMSDGVKVSAASKAYLAWFLICWSAPRTCEVLCSYVLSL